MLTQPEIKTQNLSSKKLIVFSNKKSEKLINKTLENNTKSDYTEKIEDLGKNFSYKNNKNNYWSEPELSILYGTPLYQQASETQKLALNHLYWLKLYQGVTATEIGAIIYNQIAGSLFESIGNYDNICQELELETSQEKIHVATFQRICTKIKWALLGKSSMHLHRILEGLYFQLKFVSLCVRVSFFYRDKILLNDSSS